VTPCAHAPWSDPPLSVWVHWSRRKGGPGSCAPQARAGWPQVGGAPFFSLSACRPGRTPPLIGLACVPQPLPRSPTHFPHFIMHIAMDACGSGCGGGHVAYARASFLPAGLRKPGTRACVGCFLHPSRHWASQCGPSPLPYIAGTIRMGVRWAQGQPGPAVRRCRAKSCSAGAVTWIPHTFLAGATWLVGPLESGRHPYAIPLAPSLLVCVLLQGEGGGHAGGAWVV